MKRYISYLTCALAAILAVGCIKVDIQHYSASTVAKLQLRNTDLVETRANGIESLNENYISTIQCFFSVNGTNVDYATGVINIDKNDAGNGVEHPLDIPSDVLEDLFPNGATTCNLYVLANAPAVGQVATIDAVKSTAIALEAYGTAGPAAQTSFVMDGMASVTKNTDNTLAGTVNLTRAAAKIEVDIKVNKQIVIGEGEAAVTWTPDLSKVKITYNQSVIASTVNAEPANASARASYAQTAQPFTFTTTDALSYSTGVQNMPFYSYPSQWTDNKAETAANILLEIPWKKVGATQYQTYRYQIPVNFDDMKLLRNHIYKLSINVGILGALDGVVEITPSYIVVDWKSHTINTELSRPQYLVVDQNYVVMNNVEEISVNYMSSDPVTVQISKDGNYAVYNSYEVSAANGKITLSHELDNEHNDVDKIYDYLPQTFTVTISHTNNPSISETITFVQYPAMYVTWETITSNTVYVNGNNKQSQGWWWVRGSSSASQNMYTITVNSFDATTSDYVIADPREPANTDNFVFRQDINANSNVRETATDESGDNALTGYRGAVTGEISEHLIAPQMLFSSSWISNGGNNVNTYNYQTNGKYRCAGYQENGYPAGRWRLPTPAEILYVGRLGAEGKVDGIFVNNVVYLSSNGGYRYNEANGGSVTREGDTSATLRCVYDLWYWKDKCATNQFIWGAEGDIANGAKSNYLVSVE